MGNCLKRYLSGYYEFKFLATLQNGDVAWLKEPIPRHSSNDNASIEIHESDTFFARENAAERLEEIASQITPTAISKHPARVDPDLNKRNVRVFVQNNRTGSKK